MSNKYDEMFRELYDRIFPPIKEEYDAICRIFHDLNTGKINSKTAYELLLELRLKEL